MADDDQRIFRLIWKQVPPKNGPCWKEAPPQITKTSSKWTGKNLQYLDLSILRRVTIWERLWQLKDGLFLERKSWIFWVNEFFRMWDHQKWILRQIFFQKSLLQANSTAD